MRAWLIENGIWGVTLLMFLQNVVPLAPSEIIMPLAGFLASLGILDIRTAIAAGLLGSVLGHLPWYFLGAALGERRLEAFLEKHGRLLLLRPAHVRKAGEWFDRHTAKAVLWGRLVPGFRTWINVPAGATRMSFVPYLALTIVGDAVWTAVLGYGGYLLGRDYALIAHYLHLALWPLAAMAGLLALGSAVKRVRGRRAV